ncbi:hypothetical protein HYV50_03760 [Candidatus Pacearchaeota archaeon]|nr:hypothetical protein [Candidatus Pacearchaeota archaeon]
METIKADLHNHFTTKSRVLDANKVADRVYEALGNGGICALVNYDDRRFEGFAERAEPIGNRLGNAVYFHDRNVLVIKGEELSTQQGDLLVLCLEEGKHLTQRKNLEDSLKEANDHNGIIILPHPYFHSRVGGTIEQNPKYFDYIDGIEIHNGNASRKANIRAQWLAGKTNFNNACEKYLHIGWLASSDGHSFKEVGSSYTILKLPNIKFSSSEGIIKELRNAIRLGGSYGYKKNYSMLGFIQHISIITPMFLLLKLGIKLSRGDTEALR